MEKEIFAFIAMLIAFGSKAPYLYAIYTGVKKPHIFTWVIWGFTTSVVGLAQFSDGGGAGAWPTLLAGLICFACAGVGFYKNPVLDITRSDWFFFVSALCSLPLWYVMDSPLWSVVLLVGIDVMGYFPTLRKAYVLPDEESSALFVLQTVKNVFVVAALENYSLVTLLFPVVVSVMNLAVPVCIFLGKRRCRLVA